MLSKETIRALLRDQGFELVGFSAPKPPAHMDTFQQWIAQGLHAGMAYLASERSLTRRASLQAILPEVRSVLTVGLRYPNPLSSPPIPEDQLSGRVAAYAWGKDYHDVIPPLLDEAAFAIQQASGRQASFRSYTDTGPILERDAASTAGLGWIGKNTCLISPTQGSYFLLGELLIDQEIEPDPPFTADQCGTCRRCIEACPTTCIRDDRTIDSNRCISYLTIEHKGVIPADLRPALGDWVFGCDVCQSVCPWNLRFAQPQGSALLEARPEMARPNLLEELKLDSQAFNRKFKGSPVQRTRRR
ncbi:MAG: tRNA epoxyqueuosine(34) reductase QueG, partial [Anaerolineae bacterium]|nr:tRNA epoxyqueuosine(34) reductase QueG [Anaerolineae bacterium]